MNSRCKKMCKQFHFKSNIPIQQSTYCALKKQIHSHFAHHQPIEEKEMM